MAGRLVRIVSLTLLFLSPVAAQKAPAVTPEAARLFNSAVDAFKAGNLDLAIERMRQASKSAPAHPDISLYLGLFLYEKNNQSPEAQVLLETVLPQFPADTELPLKLLNSYLLSGKTEKVSSLLASLKPRLEEDPRFAFNVIYTLVQRGQLGTAEKELTEQSRRLQGEVQFIGGLIAANSGHRTQALDLFQRAGQNGFPPPASRQTVMLADALFQLQEFRRAAESYEAYLKHFPDDKTYAFRAALCYYGTANFQKARQRLQLLLKQAPEMPEVNYYLGATLIELKQVPQAGAYFAAELKRDPGSYKTMTKLAYLSYLEGENEQCRNWLAKSLQLNPDWFESHVVMGLLQARLGQNDDAIRSFEKAIAEEPGYPKAYYQLSVAYKRAGDDARSQAALETYNRLHSAETARAAEALGMPVRKERP
ncbi:MAG TPA: tetratricopeptide repeat protein [Acidobacteriota bacterium]|nr:tetratricopeptide repeat protein [Acidobacteriota bacterium]